MSIIAEAINRITKEVGDAWQDQRAEPSTQDRRMRDDVINRLNAELLFQDVVILAAQEVERLAAQLAKCSSPEEVDSIVAGFGFPEIGALTGMAKACNDAAHTIWETAYRPLELKL